MIYSDTFVWLHFAKCAGSKTERLFETYFADDEGIIQDPIGVKLDPSISWHDSILQREKRDPGFSLGNRTVICQFRRLSSWLESRYNFEYQRSPLLDHRPELLLDGKFLERGGRENHADSYVRKYLPMAILFSGKLKLIRTEFFDNDFKAAFAEHIDISVIPDVEFRKKVNASKSYLPPDIKKELHENHQALTQKCPYWAMVEKLAYGGGVSV